MKCTPTLSTIEYNDIKNPPALFNKLKEFNEKADTKKLTEKELAYIERYPFIYIELSLYYRIQIIIIIGSQISRKWIV